MFPLIKLGILWKYSLLLAGGLTTGGLWLETPLKEEKAKPLLVERETCALPEPFLTFACVSAERASLAGRDLVAPKKTIPLLAKKTGARLPFYELYVPVPKEQKPNHIRLEKSQARKPYAGAQVVSGKFICPKKSDKPRKSKKYDFGHIDMECCLDPDEIPNPHCSY